MITVVPLDAVDICDARLKVEEGTRAFAYNDATGKRVTCQPNGNLSIGEGINLETGLDQVERDFLRRHRLDLVDKRLQAYAWYQGLDAPTASVLLDVGYNGGVETLLHFPHLLAAVGARPVDRQAAHDQLLDSKAARELPNRYKPLAQILLTGEV